MKLSIVIPAHNEEGYLEKCLESIFREQGRRNHDVEVIVVDNASTDATRKVAESFERVIIVDEPKLGLPQARQSGFMASHGDLIANVDADTIMTPGWIERVFAEFSRDGKLVALSGPFVYYDLTACANFLVKSFFSLGFIINQLSQLIFRKGSVIQGGNFILKRTALEQIGGYNTKLHFYGEDVDMAMRISGAGRIKFTMGLPIQTSARRIKAEGILMTGFGSVFDYLWLSVFKKPFRKSVYRGIR